MNAEDTPRKSAYRFIKFCLKNLPNYQKNSIVSKELQRRESGTVTCFAFDQGEGEAEIIIDSKPNHLTQGEVIIMPANHPHMVKGLQAVRNAAGDDIPCSHCFIYQARQKAKIWFTPQDASS